MELDLVNSRRDLEPRVGEELLKILDSEVGDTNVLHAARFGQLLHLSPGVLEVPVGVVLLQVIWVGRRGPVLSGWLACLTLRDGSCTGLNIP